MRNDAAEGFWYAMSTWRAAVPPHILAAIPEAAMRYIEVSTDPQDFTVLSKCPCQHSWCSWA
jgi:hypothetical protein